MEIRALTANTGVEVLGVDLRGVVEKKKLNDLLAKHSVVVFREQKLGPPEYMKAAQIWGEIMPQMLERFTLPEYPLVGFVRRDLPQHARDLGVRDLAPGPELRQAAAFGGLRERQGDDPRPVADHAFHLERAVERADLDGKRKRLAAIEIGQHRRGRISPGGRERRREVGHRRAFELADERAHALLDLLDRVDVGEGAAAELGGARHQEGVRRRADADHEDAGAPAHGADGLEQLLLVADPPSVRKIT